MISKPIQTAIRRLAGSVTLAALCSCGGSDNGNTSDNDAGGGGDVSPNNAASTDSQSTPENDASQDSLEPYEGEPYLFQEITVGVQHTVARTTDGSVMWWGAHYLYEYVGNGGNLNETVWSVVPKPFFGLGSGTIAVAAGSNHACAIDVGGKVLCWGSNSSGQLGDGLRNDSFEPHPVVGLDSGFVALSAQSNTTCALSQEGDVWCWGSTSGVTSGHGASPAQVHGFGPNVRAIATGNGRTCAITSTGAVMCGGSNEDGELGDGTTESRSEPVAVLGLEAGVKAICAGFSHNCAITSEDEVYCWGTIATVTFENGVGWRHPAPTRVDGLETGVKAISCGSFHTCAITATGEAKCFGGNGNGQLGDGTTTNRATPKKVVGLNNNVTSIAAGPGSTCALTDQNETFCWGWNSEGQLGDGTLTNRLAATKVYGTP